MKITVEFANLNEFKQYMGVESPNLLAQASKETEDAPALAEAVQEPQKAPEDPAPKKRTPRRSKRPPLRKLSPLLSLLTRLHPLRPQK